VTSAVPHPVNMFHLPKSRGRGPGVGGRGCVPRPPA
jgi:hypothetical protein